jgi:hypothetical protein
MTWIQKDTQNWNSSATDPNLDLSKAQLMKPKVVLPKPDLMNHHWNFHTSVFIHSFIKSNILMSLLHK